VSTAANPARLRWLRALLLGVAAEVALMFVVVPFYFLPHPTEVLQIVIAPASFLVMAAFGYWAARRAPARQVLLGLLAGVGGVLFYLAMMLAYLIPGAPPMNTGVLFSFAYLLAHALKLAGGAFGGFLAARR
jgi:hypothetical protein